MNKSIIISFLFHLIIVTVAIVGLPKMFSNPDLPIPTTINLEILEDIEQKPTPTLQNQSLPKIAINKPIKPIPENASNSIIQTPKQPTKVEKKNNLPKNIPPVPSIKPNLPEPKVAKINEKISILDDPKKNTKNSSEKIFDDMLRDLATQEEPANKTKKEEDSKISLAEKTIAELAESKNDLLMIPEPGEIHKIALIIKRQVDKEWSRPPGLKTSGEIAIGLLITLNRDGSITHLEIDSEAKKRMRNEPTFRPFVESALRAVRKASPIKGLPQKRYMIWKKLKLNFRPPETMS